MVSRHTLQVWWLLLYLFSAARFGDLITRSYAQTSRPSHLGMKFVGGPLEGRASAVSARARAHPSAEAGAAQKAEERVVTGILRADEVPGRDAGEKLAACIEALPPTGGTCDGRGFEGAQKISGTILLSKPVQLLFGHATFTFTGTGPMFEIPKTARGPIIFDGVGGWDDAETGTVFDNRSNDHAIHCQLPFGNGALILRGLNIRSGLGANRTAGNAIEVNFGDGFTSVQAHIENVDAFGHMIGVHIVQSIGSHLERVRAGGLTNAFLLNGGTSTSLVNTYAIGAREDNYVLTHEGAAFGPVYMTLMGTASDGAGRDGYSLQGASAVTLVGVGAEGTGRYPYYLKDCNEIVVLNPFINSAAGNTSDGVRIEGCQGVTIENPALLGPGTGAHNTGISAQASATPISVSNVTVLGGLVAGWPGGDYSDPQGVMTLINDRRGGAAGVLSLRGAVAIGARTPPIGSLYVTRSVVGDNTPPIVTDQAETLGLPFLQFTTGNNAKTYGRLEISRDALGIRGGTEAAPLALALTAPRVQMSEQLSVGTGVFNDGGGFKHNRVPTCITRAASGSTCDTRLLWKTPFADLHYTASCTISDVNNQPLLLSIVTKATGYIVVRIRADSAAPGRGTLNCIAVHD